MHRTLRLSPDGKRLAVSEGGVAANIFVYDLATQASMRLTFGAGEGDTSPVWLPDGQWIAYGKHETRKNYAMHRKRADGSGGDELLSAFSRDRIPLSWSSDGRYLLYSEGSLGAGDIGALPLFGGRKPFLVVALGADSYNGQFSPDNRWVAYTSVQGGDQQVYVTSFPDHANTWQVTTKGCTEPRWNPHGHELFFCISSDNHLMSVDVDGRSSSFQVGAARPLFAAPLHTSTCNMWSHDVTGDGQRFLFAADASSSEASSLTIVVNWVPTAK